MWHTVSVNWGASYRIGKPFGPNGINYHLIMVWTERRKRIRKIEDRRVTITSPGPPRITSALVNSPGRMHHRSYSPSWLVFYEMWSGPRPLIIYFHISAIQSQRVLSCWAGHLRRERAARDHFGEGYIHCIILENPRIQAKKLMVES